ncbi:MAG: hypothetical protein EBR86_08345 [Planctomycetia bacterium]|nr:hypothetical protein [Planctomycetia bacterium]
MECSPFEEPTILETRPNLIRGFPVFAASLHDPQKEAPFSSISAVLRIVVVQRVVVVQLVVGRFVVMH